MSIKGKTNKIIPWLIILILLVAIVGAAFVFLLPKLSGNYEVYDLLNALAKEPRLSMMLDVNATVDGSDVLVLCQDLVQVKMRNFSPF